MKRSLTILVALSLLLPVSAIAHPGPGGPGGPGHGGWGWGPRPGMSFDRLPYGVETVLIAGLTYYVVNGIFYQRQNDQYVVVDTPPNAATATTQGGMTVLDMNGERFYVKNGFYYKRNINGEYIEVPKPAGL
ncbi:hypothetical protein BIY26_11025 [Brenneria goodwinii]|uniref:Uncharacterized protein n=2 Tax=Brenneria goodwinii TaxID=1109412 RepID=A0AAE8JN56_9GAMM|nr:DUF6515 family protein [Brenneria goodwinii]ATA22906.1 hypothetical protein AWC36_01615 [Brenneria goodwinii]MCG8157158.1 hypothetical protein [Brenneria goodwinii]MCG8160102.1 hypothetical protein [Brenneria goodwinii]MCG8164625.1 hypothetical protein [Brenneria goodwinii]MCG8170669.1 hypothetical protein [Brenneria goodwinii]